MESEKIQSRDEVFLTKLTEAVLHNLENEQFGVTELSEAVAISRFQLHRKLKVLKGQSISQFIREIRLAEAMKLLRADAATTSEIGYKVGFTSPSYFNKCFHDFYGYAPGEVKKRTNGFSESTVTETSPPSSGPPPESKRPMIKTAWVIAVPLLVIALLIYIFVPSKRDAVSIAVLPLDNLTGSDEQAYFVNGMHDAIIGELGQVSGLRVISRTSTLRYQKTEMLIQDIARELGVDVIVEGSVYGLGDSVRVQLQLIEAFPKERHLWAQQYHEDIQHALAMHSSVVRDIAKEIRVSLTPEEETRLNETRVVNPSSYKAYLRAMHYINQFTPESVDRGMSYLLEATREDPADPLLWAGLAIGYNYLGHGPSPPPDAYTNSKAAARKALALDESLAETHLALAMIALYRDWDWKTTDSEFKRALEINPNLADAHSNYAWFKMLYGQQEEALRHAKKATELDPFSYIHSTYRACELWWYGSYDEALQEVEKALKLMPDYGLALMAKGGSYSYKGMHRDAIETLTKAAEVSDDWRWTLGNPYVVAGKSDEARKIAEEIRIDPSPIDTWGLAEIYAALGDKDEAFHWLDECYKVRFSWMPWVAWNPNYRSLHDDPRFDALLKRLDLPPLQKNIAKN
jgi:TolB-like protein/AraC-like DNA-binding protein/Tfp pilus assembly protein PilF